MPSSPFEFSFVYDDVVLATFRLPAGEYVIGRDPKCAIAIDLEGIEERHARLVLGPEAAIHTVAQSAETFVEGKKIRGRKRLVAGRRVRFGKCPGFLRLEAGAKATEPTASAPEAAKVPAATPSSELAAQRDEVQRVSEAAQEMERGLRAELARVAQEARHARTAEAAAATDLLALKQRMKSSREQLAEAGLRERKLAAELEKLRASAVAAPPARPRSDSEADEHGAELLGHANEVVLQKLAAAGQSAREIEALKKQLHQREQALAEALIRRQQAENHSLQLARHADLERPAAAAAQRAEAARFSPGRALVALWVLGVAFAVAVLALTVRSRGERAVRAEATVAAVRGAAGQFFHEAEACRQERRFEEALQQVDYAIALQEDSARYHALRGQLCESLLQMGPAIAAYTRALELDPAIPQVRENLELCHGIASTRHGTGSPEALYALHRLMFAQQRWPEALRMAQRLAADGELLYRTWTALLESASFPGRLRLNEADGTFDLDLSRYSAPDLRLLRDLPLRRLDLSKSYVSDLAPLRGLKLRELNLSGTRIRDLSPLEGMPLVDLDLSDTEVSILFPLSGMPLERLVLDHTSVSDLSALRGMPLRTLRATGTTVWNLAPLAEMPLQILELARTRVASVEALAHLPLVQLNLEGTKVQSLEPLRGAHLRSLQLARTAVESLEPLRGTPIQELDLAGCEHLKSVAPLAACPDLERLMLPAGMNDLDLLRRSPSLRFLADEFSGEGAAEQTSQQFWKKRDAATLAKGR